MHPRNRHTGRYDFPALIALYPALAPFVRPTPFGGDEDLSIDFANPAAVKALNRALLIQFYHLSAWDFPEGYLCPPIPGRSDYIHHIADLLADYSGDVIPRGKDFRVLDVGVGASAIYPIIGRGEYGWSFVGVDTDRRALDSAQSIVDANPSLGESVVLRHQSDAQSIFKNVVQPAEKFDLVICNPPFHASQAEAEAGSRRKWQNLGHESKAGYSSKPELNFGGQSSELWCLGGEVGFIRRMISESVEMANRVFCFSTLVSTQDHLESLYDALERAGALNVGVIEMNQGQKKSRILAWAFLKPAEQTAWARERWRP